MVLRRLGSVENKLEKMVCYTSRLIPTVLISKTRLNSCTLLTLYSVSIIMQVDVMSFY